MSEREPSWYFTLIFRGKPKGSGGPYGSAFEAQYFAKEFLKSVSDWDRVEIVEETR